MVYPLVFILLLVLLAATIAYLADRLGRYVGKNRLSLWGWRPRRTGQIIGMLSGVAVMFVTLGMLSVLDRSSIQVALNARQAARELQLLRVQQAELSQQIAASDARLQRLEQERQQLIDDNAQARADLLQLHDEFASATRQLSSTRQQLRHVSEERNAAQAELDVLEQALQARQAELEMARANLQQASDEINLQQRHIGMESARIATLSNAYQRLEIEADLLNSRNQHLQQRNSQLSHENQRLSSQNVRVLEEIAQLSLEVAQLEECAVPIAREDTRPADAQP